MEKKYTGRGGWRGGGRPKKEGQVILYKRCTEAERQEMQAAWEYLQKNGVFKFDEKTELDYLKEYAFEKGVHSGYYSTNDFLTFYHAKKYTMGWDQMISAFNGEGRRRFELEYIRAERDKACPDCGQWTYNSECGGECKMYLHSRQTKESP